MLTLNLPAFDYKIKQKEGRLFIWDRIRKKYIALQPEEWVRQHFVNYLIEVKKVPAGRISLELGHRYNHLAKRSDILVWDAALKPFLLIECKAPHVEINDDVYFQALTYHSQIGARYIALTNGMVHHFFENQGGADLVKIDELPDYMFMGR